MKVLVHFWRFFRQRWKIWTVIPILTVTACYFITRYLPDVYVSKGRLATGLVDKTGQILSLDDRIEQDSELNRKFENLIQLIRLKKVMDQVSYKLILHDLKAKQGAEFRKLPSDLSPDFKKKTIALLTQKLEKLAEFNPVDENERKIESLIKEMGYDAGAILSDLKVTRILNSDYIEIEFKAESPVLASYTVDTVIEEFLRVYAERIQESNTRSLDFLEKHMLEKLAALNGKMEELKNYKIRNRVLNLNEQAKSLYGHIIDFETRREVARKDVVAYGAAIRNIDKKFDPTDRKYLESSMVSINQSITQLKENLRFANDVYIKSNFDPAYKSRVDSLQKQLSRQIVASSDKYIYNPLSIKEDLVNHKLELEIALELAQNSIKTIETEVSRLNGKFDVMVPNEASIQKFETGIDIAGREYIEALQRYNSAKLESFNPISIKVAERASQGEKLPSRKRVLVLLSGIISLALCLLVFFILYYLDRSIQTARQLADETGLVVLGVLNKINFLTDIGQLDRNDGGNSKKLFRDRIRSVRFEVDSETNGSKVISVTSLTEKGEGTQVVCGLAWAYRRINKRVLVVDGNYNSSRITAEVSPGAYFEEYLKGGVWEGTGDFQTSGTRGGDVSVLELVDSKQLQNRLAALKNEFDVVIIDSGSLNALNKAREWITYSDRVVAAYPAGRTITEEDEVHTRYLRSLGAAFSGWVLTNVDF